MSFAQRSACDRCRSLKSRCSSESGAAKCDRCRRLQIDCFYSPPRRLGRPTKQRRSKAATQSTPSASRNSSKSSSITTQTKLPDTVPSNVNDPSGLDIRLETIPRYPAMHTVGLNNFENSWPLQANDPSTASMNWINTYPLGCSNHQPNTAETQLNEISPGKPTMICSSTSSAKDSWILAYDLTSVGSHFESFTYDTLSLPPEAFLEPSDVALGDLLALDLDLWYP